MPGEVWRPIPSHHPYHASSLGRIASTKTRTSQGKVLTARPNSAGYLVVGLRVGGGTTGRLVNRLVAEAFHGPPPSTQHDAAHENGVRHDNIPDNLRWKTKKENNADKVRHGTLLFGEDHGSARLSNKEVQEMRSAMVGGASNHFLAKTYNLHQQYVAQIRRGDRRATA